MTTNWWYWYLTGASFLTMGGVSSSLRDCALAQITPDSTLGAERSIVKLNDNIKQIDGGATRGTNLFHSFEQFSVLTGNEAHFNNALDIQNIISRVTGRSVSNIDGLLRAKGTANLFLINPNGIIFGPNASLKIGGSFLGSTASSLNFADSTQFRATAPQTSPLLTVSIPLGLQFGGSAGSIQNQSRMTDSSGQVIGLQVQPGKTLALLGGEVHLDGGNLQALGGRVELGGVAGAGTVGLNVDGNNLNLSFPDGVASADVSLIRAKVDITPRNRSVGARGGGTIAINAGNISIAHSLLFADTRIADGIAGNILVQGNGNVSIVDNSSLYSRAFREKGKAGSISVQANGDVFIANNSTFSTVTFEATSEEGDAGSVSVRANGDVFIIDESRLSSEALGGQGDAGRLSVRANGDVSVNNSSISSSTKRNPGAAGTIEVSASSIRLDNQASISSDTTAGQGNIILNAQNLVLRRGSNITTDATGTATGGNITIDTDVLAALENSDIKADAEESFGGQVIINAQGIFGTEFRDATTPESDITATSDLGPQFNGIVEINTPDVDPSRGLVTQPAELVDASGLIAQTCPAGGGQGQSKFIVTGRGGLPPNSSEALSTEPVQVEWVSLNPRVEKTKSPAVSSNPTTPPPAPLVEAQGWVINALGEVVLTAQAPTVTPHSSWQIPTSCRMPKSTR